MENENRPDFTDIGCVFALSRELGGLIDRLPRPVITTGNGLKYYKTTLGKQSLVIVESGMGMEKAAEATDALMQIFRPARVISAGFAGALTPSLEKNQIVIPNRMICQENGQSYDLLEKRISSGTGKEGSAAEGSAAECSENIENPEETKSSVPVADCRQEAVSSKLPDLSRYATGTLLTATHLIDSTEEKKKLAKEFNASLVDMETWSVWAICQKWSVPFLPIRVIYDTLDEVFSPEIKNVSQSTESAARLTGAIFGAILRRPSSVVDMFKMNNASVTASDILAKAICELLEE